MATFQKDFTLQDVSNAITDRRKTTFTRLKCYVVNYTADCDFPHKFYYNGCTHARGLNHCSHGNCEHGCKWKVPMYRFKLQLTDRSPEPPLTVSIFGMGHILMGMTPEEFSRRSFEAQLAMVKAKTSNATLFDCHIKVKEDYYTGEFVAVLNNMYLVTKEMEEIYDEMREMKTPPSAPPLCRTLADIDTLQSPDSATSNPFVSSATRRGGRGGSSSSTVRNVKTLPKELVDVGKNWQTFLRL